MSAGAGREAMRPGSEGNSPEPASGGGAASRGGEAPATGGGGTDDPPPVLGRWSRLYVLVALELALVIVVLYWLTRRYA